MKFAALALGFALSAGSVLWAQDLPARYDVTGVGADDVLNVRAAPTASAQKLGALDHDRTGVEVIAVEGGWGRVSIGDGSGWASLRYLARIPGQWAGGLPDPRSCFGTEPFWALMIADDTLSLQRPDAADLDGAINRRATSANRTDRYLISGELDGARADLVLGRAECSDGMSDRLYGLTADLLFGDALMSGCCSVADR